MAITTTKPPSLRQVEASEGCDAIVSALREDGGVIIKNLVTTDQVCRINKEIDPVMEKLAVGTKLSDERLQDFHGYNTKRLTNLVTHSKTFREEVLEHDLIHQICEAIFMEDAGTYWMNSAQTIEIGPGSNRQELHRDQIQYPIFTYCGADAPEAVINFMVALTKFTEESGATRVVPGSHKWANFREYGTHEDSVPAEMEVGDACLFSGKVSHGGGANRTRDFKRRGLAITFQPSYLTPEEAYPFLIRKELAMTLSPRAQRLLGFRSQFPKDTLGLWKCDYSHTDDVVYYPAT
ncbi:Verruculogen synthase [Purpureocillium takamizusanense]|uniref:Verruculogen synthase n=1 Tax=Purpureocillium takamizusanense TaxID=2060973 RepID=A0A9Q8QFS2_9HYPO|nr:Verruculogen synthase [Purpureocillium takamizusanense]UNI18432.1 Verruculogen synthase [Purpureocillium takamizusanense]